MVRRFLTAERNPVFKIGLAVAGMLLLLALPVSAKKEKTIAQAAPPDLLMDGGRRLAFERVFSLEREVKPSPPIRRGGSS